jgi:predicted nucleotide-binding protein
VRTVSLDPLKGFLRAAKGRSQERIIVEFLMATVIADPISDHGSVLINHPRQQKLIVFNEGDFLFESKLLDPAARSAWPKEFSYFEGVAGAAFREGRTQVYPKRGARGGSQDFWGQSPIKNMVCIPIVTTPGEPFGVVCFHNNDADKVFTDEDINALESYVDILAIALHTPHPELQLEKNVFIVHGRDQNTLNELQVLLMKHKVNPKILVREDKGPKWILQEVEDLIRVCKAGFILATPDDEGRLRGNEEEALQWRARENVIFETGLLFAKFREFDRVALLLKKPLTLPSDLAGIAYDEFDRISEIELSIVAKLQKWGLKQA